MKTMQEVYDTTVEHVWKQGRRSIHEDACKYRTEDGARCAVGVWRGHGCPRSPALLSCYLTKEL